MNFLAAVEGGFIRIAAGVDITCCCMVLVLVVGVGGTNIVVVVVAVVAVVAVAVIDCVVGKGEGGTIALAGVAIGAVGMQDVDVAGIVLIFLVDLVVLFCLFPFDCFLFVVVVVVVVTLPTVLVVEIDKPDFVVVVIVIGLETFFTGCWIFVELVNTFLTCEVFFCVRTSNDFFFFNCGNPLDNELKMLFDMLFALSLVPKVRALRFIWG